MADILRADQKENEAESMLNQAIDAEGHAQLVRELIVGKMREEGDPAT